MPAVQHLQVLAQVSSELSYPLNLYNSFELVMRISTLAQPKFE